MFNKDLAEAAHLLERGISWDLTPQGFDYWAQVHENLLSAAGKLPIQANVKNTQSIIQSKVIVFHIFDKGSSLCGLKGNPQQWSIGNKFVRLHDKDKATCSFCKAKAPL